MFVLKIGGFEKRTSWNSKKCFIVVVAIYFLNALTGDDIELLYAKVMDT